MPRVERRKDKVALAGLESEIMQEEQSIAAGQHIDISLVKVEQGDRHRDLLASVYLLLLFFV